MKHFVDFTLSKIFIVLPNWLSRTTLNPLGFIVSAPSVSSKGDARGWKNASYWIKRTPGEPNC